MSFDIQKIIDQTYESHTEETEEDDVGFLSIEERIIDPSEMLEKVRESNHESHNQQEDAASHRRSPFLVFMEFGEYLGFFAGDCSFADSLSEFELPEDADIDGIEYPRNEKRDQRKHDDVIEFD